MAYVPEIESKLLTVTGENAICVLTMIANLKGKYQRRLERAKRIE